MSILWLLFLIPIIFFFVSILTSLGQHSSRKNVRAQNEATNYQRPLESGTLFAERENDTRRSWRTWDDSNNMNDVLMMNQMNNSTIANAATMCPPPPAYTPRWIAVRIWESGSSRRGSRSFHLLSAEAFFVDCFKFLVSVITDITLLSITTITKPLSAAKDKLKCIPDSSSQPQYTCKNRRITFPQQTSESKNQDQT